MIELIIKILIIIVILGVGFGFIYAGWTIFTIDPYRDKNQEFNSIFKFATGQEGHLEIKLKSESGFIPDARLYVNVTAKFPEFQNNTSTVQIKFPSAIVFYSVSDNVPEIDKPIGLRYLSNDERKVSTYFADPILRYPYDGKFDAILIIDNEDTRAMEKQFGATHNRGGFKFLSYVEIKPEDYYSSQERDNNSLGLTLIIAGAGIMPTAAVFVKLVDLFKGLSRSKKKWDLETY